MGMQHSTVTSALLGTSHLDKAISMTRPSQSEAKFIKVEICDVRTLDLRMSRRRERERDKKRTLHTPSQTPGFLRKSCA